MKKLGITNNKGFSLIELSIVLIIIGLLVAGITGGASLIKSAELRSIMTEARAYKMAVNAYYTSQDRLPGDDSSTTMGMTAHPGDNNGEIEAVNSVFTAEGTEAWNDMSDSDVGILDMAEITIGTDITDPTSALSPALEVVDMGDSKYKAAGWAFDYAETSIVVGDNTTTISSADINSNTLIFTGETVIGTTPATIPTAILTYLEALSIDTKMDDGAHNTGAVYGGVSTCLSNATAKACSLYVKIDL